MSRASRSCSLSTATDSTSEILGHARLLLDQLRTRTDRLGLTLIGISLESLESADAIQMVLPLQGEGSDGRATDGSLDRAVDTLRERFGAEAVTRASLVDLERNQGSPTLPEPGP